jgi:hypothetical protein
MVPSAGASSDLYEIPFVPILEKERKDWSMFRDFLVKERVLEPVRFIDQAAQSPGQRSYRTRREADREATEAPGRDFWKSLLSASFYRYWMHRLQHTVPFLWELHSYHHRVTDLQATNTFVSHPIDFALRNVVFGLVLGIIGFNPLAIVIGTTASFAPGVFSHCGAEVKGGFLNYLFVTPEVHRWHHSEEVRLVLGLRCTVLVRSSSGSRHADAH